MRSLQNILILILIYSSIASAGKEPQTNYGNDISYYLLEHKSFSYIFKQYDKNQGFGPHVVRQLIERLIKIAYDKNILKPNLIESNEEQFLKLSYVKPTYLVDLLYHPNMKAIRLRLLQQLILIETAAITHNVKPEEMHQTQVYQLAEKFLKLRLYDNFKFTYDETAIELFGVTTRYNSLLKYSPFLLHKYFGKFFHKEEKLINNQFVPSIRVFILSHMKTQPKPIIDEINLWLTEVENSISIYQKLIKVNVALALSEEANNVFKEVLLELSKREALQRKRILRQFSKNNSIKTSVDELKKKQSLIFSSHDHSSTKKSNIRNTYGMNANEFSAFICSIFFDKNSN